VLSESDQVRTGPGRVDVAVDGDNRLFISYSRRDAAIVHALYDGLKARGIGSISSRPTLPGDADVELMSEFPYPRLAEHVHGKRQRDQLAVEQWIPLPRVAAVQLQRVLA